MHDQPRIATLIMMAAAVTALTGMAVHAQEPPDPADRLAVDPITLWNTFMGGDSNEWGNGIARDGSGNIYVTGFSYTTWGSPVDPYLGGTEACVVKLNTNGVRQWNTFLGSANSDGGSGIAVDSSNDVYVTGRSYAEWGSPIDPHPGSHYDAFVTRLNGSNGARRWNTFAGFSNTSYGRGVAVGKTGGVYVAGDSKARTGAYIDAFLVRLSGDGTRSWDILLERTSANDYAKDVVVSIDGSQAFVVGESYASWGVPIVSYTDGSDAFAASIELPVIFADGFESGDMSELSVAIP